MNYTAERSVSEYLSGSLAQQAAVWGFPLVLAGRYLNLANERKFSFNQFHHNLRLATPSLNVVGPNIDTLYGLAWIDLTEGPQVLEVPDTLDRYYSIQLCDAYLMTFMYVGRRETGTRARAFAITGSNWSGRLPPNMVEIRAPTNIVLAVARTFIKGSTDLADAQAVQLQYSLGSLPAYPHERSTAVAEENALDLLPPIDMSHCGAEYFDELCALLLTHPPNSADRAHLSGFAALGLAPGKKPSQDPVHAPILAAAVAAGMEQIRNTNFFFSESGGWSWSPSVTNYSFDNPLLRASINFLGPGWHLAPEALYFSTIKSDDGERLSGLNRYVLTFPAGLLPPVDAFWSVTMYGERFSLVPNEQDRYSFNSYTEGLLTNPDGSLDLYIQSTVPQQGSSNWLPAPPGPFMIFLRAYQPRAAVVNGSYKPPLPRRLR